MSFKELKREEWKGWMDGLTRELTTCEVSIPVEGLPLESPSERPVTRLIALVYDPPGNIMTVSTEDFDHFIDEPSSLGLDLRPDGVHGLRVVDPEGREHHIPLSKSLTAPSLDAHFRLRNH